MIQVVLNVQPVALNALLPLYVVNVPKDSLLVKKRVRDSRATSVRVDVQPALVNQISVHHANKEAA